jgi:hypothetical protein
LCDRLCAGRLPAGLHAREAAKPGQLHLVVGECCDRSRVAFHGNVFDRHAELGLELLGDLGEALNETALVLVGDGGEDESRFGLRLRLRQTGKESPDEGQSPRPQGHAVLHDGSGPSLRAAYGDATLNRTQDITTA